MTDFSLIETLRHDSKSGFVRLPLHLARLKRSARRLGIPGAEGAERALSAAAANEGDTPVHRVRLELFPDGRIEVKTAPFAPLPEDTVWNVRIAETRLASSDPLLRYKTSCRTVYEKARAEFSSADADEVILLNEKGEVCEGTITSIFLDDGSGVLKTPPVACGLLSGVLRTEMICTRRARTARLSPEDLDRGALYVGNSLRGMIRVRLRV
ncbi:aminotransferase class IV family protein [Ensifer sp. MJa1]|uniref:aminotransferase class IV family protein n=1 Tax=Ensifer sp. MJa1 TaxID=2919888 RepID=UPI00300BB134